MCDSRDALRSALREIVADLEPSSLRAEDAKVLVKWFSQMEKLSAAGKALCARRVADTGSYLTDGFKTPGSWLAAQTGENVGGAINLLQAAEEMAALPEVEDAFRAGELSAAQAEQVAGAATVDPSAERELLEAAKQKNLKGLKRRCEQLKAEKRSKEDEAARYERVRRSRYVRHWTDSDGAVRLEAKLTPDDGAKLLASLQAETERIFGDARRSGLREFPEAYSADALVALVTRDSAGPASSAGPKVVVQLRVDLEALRRGSTEAGELCEIVGVGPVSVATAKGLLGDSLLKLVIAKGTEVATVCTLGRTIPAALRTAIETRDPKCVVPGCESTHRLEIDHRVIPFVEGGPTALWNLARLCLFHHRLKTHRGYRLEGAPGSWVWIHPDGTRDESVPDRAAIPHEAPSGDDDIAGTATPASHQGPAAAPVWAGSPAAVPSTVSPLSMAIEFRALTAR